MTRYLFPIFYKIKKPATVPRTEIHFRNRDGAAGI